MARIRSKMDKSIILQETFLTPLPFSLARSFFWPSVIADVINSVRESFLDESVDENILLELKVHAASPFLKMPAKCMEYIFYFLIIFVDFSVSFCVLVIYLMCLHSWSFFVQNLWVNKLEASRAVEQQPAPCDAAALDSKVNSLSRSQNKCCRVVLRILNKA